MWEPRVRAAPVQPSFPTENEIAKDTNTAAPSSENTLL
jgi:hypothetical protein